MWDWLSNPPTIADYSDYFRTLLSVSGTLLGLVFTALVLVIENGFSSFKYSRRMFLELYARFGKHLLVTLAYLTVTPLIAVYFSDVRSLLNIVYYVFVLLFIRSILDYQSHRGYIYTLNSAKFVPRNYGNFRRYFRYITNLGLINLVVLFVYIFVFTVYPVLISPQQGGIPEISKQGLFYSTLLLLIYSILQIAYFIPEYFKLSNSELEYAKKTNEGVSIGDEADIDYIKEKQALKMFLIDHGMRELGRIEKVKFLDGSIDTELIENKSDEAWFNIYVEMGRTDVFIIRKRVLEYGYDVLKLLNNSMVDLNSFALSIHIKLPGESASRNMFIRVSRAELKDVLSTSVNAEQAVRKIKNKLFDELFRDLQNLPR